MGSAAGNSEETEPERTTVRDVYKPALVTSSTQAWAMDTPGVNTSVANSVTVTGVGTVTIEAPLVQLTVGMNFSDSSVQDVVKDMNIVKQKVTSVLPLGAALAR